MQQGAPDMTDTNSVLVERDGPVTIVSINRPHCRNAVDGATARKLYDAFLAFNADAEASVAVFTGTGGYFCAGADLKAVASGDPNKKREIGGHDSIAPMGPSRLRLSKPVIAAVEGFAVAGGMELALWADMRVVAEDATFGVFCRRFGVPLIDLGTIRLPRLIGHSQAIDLILTGRPVGAAEALRMGLANRLVPKARPARRRSRWQRISPASRKPACAPTGCRRCGSGIWKRKTPSPMKCAAGLPSLPPAKRSPARHALRPARDDMARSVGALAKPSGSRPGIRHDGVNGRRFHREIVAKKSVVGMRRSRLPLTVGDRGNHRRGQSIRHSRSKIPCRAQ
jgi:enoyl-CoA hydratase